MRLEAQSRAVWLCAALLWSLGCDASLDPSPDDGGSAVDASEPAPVDGGECAACDDGNACTVDRCGSDGCVNAADDARCDDGIACTVDQCGADGCLHLVDADACDDGDPCTAERCDVTAGCVQEDTTAACDDGVYCNGADSCMDGLCAVHAGSACSASQTCDEESDACVGCVTDADCPAAVTGAWGACADFGGTCDVSGTRTRTDMVYTCELDRCVGQPTELSEACPRDTEGRMCADDDQAYTQDVCADGACTHAPVHAEEVMTLMTANIGRDYGSRTVMRDAIVRIGDFMERRSGPRFIGWQEIGGADPCGGSCEIEEIRARFGAGWTTYHQSRYVPITSAEGGANVATRAVFASPAWAGVSVARYITVAYYPRRNLSVLNTHLIAGAWSGGSNIEQRREYWRQAWETLREEVAREHDRGRNVIVTGDFNRRRDSTPAWDPASLHPAAVVIGGQSIDYVFAVPARAWSWAYDRTADGTIRRGDVAIGIDSHRAFWVMGRFRR